MMKLYELDIVVPCCSIFLLVTPFFEVWSKWVRRWAAASLGRSSGPGVEALKLSAPREPDGGTESGVENGKNHQFQWVNTLYMVN